jgi:glycosyltransferase involved in cell wall biosynthesis
VLFVNHTGEVSGGERSLLSLLGALPAEVEPLLASPGGALELAAAAMGIPTTRITGTAGSLRLHPLHTPVALAQMSIAAAQLRRAARAHGSQVIHANSIRAGIVLALGRPRGAVAVTHVRDCLPPGIASTATLRLIAARSSVILANSQYTADSVARVVPGARLRVVHNPVDLDVWDPQLIDRERSRAGLGQAGERAVLLGVLAQLSPWKGQAVAVEALGILRAWGVDAHLLLIGSAKFVARATRFDNEGYVRTLRERIAELGIEDRVSWMGERQDVPELVRALDMLLLPSREEPFGRALIEAMALGVPVLATSVGGPREIIQDGVQGRLLAPDDPHAWAEAIREIAADPELAARMGAAGRARVEQAFSSGRHCAQVISVYERELERLAA